MEHVKATSIKDKPILSDNFKNNFILIEKSPLK